MTTTSQRGRPWCAGRGTVVVVRPLERGWRPARQQDVDARHPRRRPHPTERPTGSRRPGASGLPRWITCFQPDHPQSVAQPPRVSGSCRTAPRRRGQGNDPATSLEADAWLGRAAARLQAPRQRQEARPSDDRVVGGGTAAECGGLTDEDPAVPGAACAIPGCCSRTMWVPAFGAGLRPGRPTSFADHGAPPAACRQTIAVEKIGD